MQACLSEGMRVYPPVPTLTREAERDMDLGGYKIEKGTMLGVAVFSMHNNPAYWKVGELHLAPLLAPQDMQGAVHCCKRQRWYQKPAVATLSLDAGSLTALKHPDDAPSEGCWPRNLWVTLICTS